jgi:hypothetical protein
MFGYVLCTASSPSERRKGGEVKKLNIDMPYKSATPMKLKGGLWLGP